MDTKRRDRAIAVVGPGPSPEDPKGGPMPARIAISDTGSRPLGSTITIGRILIFDEILFQPELYRLH